LLNYEKKKIDSNKIDEIKKCYNGLELNEKINEYKNSANIIESEILKNDNFKDCPLYKKIESDINNFKTKFYTLN